VNWIRLILPVLGVLLGGYLFLCVAGPDRVHVEASADFDAPLSRVRSSVVELDRWANWSPFVERASNYSVLSTDCKSVVLKVSLGDCLAWEEHWYFERAGAAETTRVTWEYVQDEVPFLTRGLLVLRGEAKQIARSHEDGLAALLLYVKGPDWHRVAPYSIEEQLFAGLMVRNILDADLKGGAHSRRMHAQLLEHHENQFGAGHAEAVKLAPMTVFIAGYDPVTAGLDLLYCLPINEDDQDDQHDQLDVSRLMVYQLGAAPAWRIKHYGPQYLTGDAWGDLYANAATHSQTLQGWPFEVYQSEDLRADSTDFSLCNQRVELVYPL
jgi:hypothetical protein